METKATPTPAAIRQSFVELRANLARHQIVPMHVIESYPISRRDRGLCKLQVEYQPGQGFRRIKTTTDKQGHWCKPKKSVWDGYPNYVITGDLAPRRTAAWLQVSPQRIAYLYPHCEVAVLLCNPCPFGKPRREAETVVFRKVTLTFGTVPQQESRDEMVMPADPPELCDAYDAWLECFGEFRREYEERCNLIVNQREMVTA